MRDEVLERVIEARGGTIRGSRHESRQVSNAQLGEIAADLQKARPGKRVMFASKLPVLWGDPGASHWYIWEEAIV